MIYKKIVFITAILMSLWCANKSMAQSKVTGIVTENGIMPLPGVSVIIKGTTIGVSTDFDGKYAFSEGINDNSILVFSYLGFKTQEILVNGQSVIDVQLQEDTSLLDEVVLVGYGSQLKKDITGSVSTIDSEAFESRPNTQVGSLLQGQTAGVQVISGSGKPSGGFSVRIRGTNSINASSEPLYVVDGVPTTDTRAINPSDIDTITVLKDASSAAIYGAQGANGVVLITTKRGTTAKPKVSLDVYTGVSQVWNTLPVLNGEQYRDLMTEMGLTTDWDSYTERTDWQDEIFQNGFSQNYQASVSGKTEGTNYFVSAGHLSQEGAVRSSEIARSNFKINFDQDINDWLKIGTRIAYTSYKDVDVNDNNSVNQGGVLLGALTTPSIIGVYNDNGMFTSNPFQNWENPLASTDGLDREYNNERFLGNIYLEAKFLENFKYRFNYGIDNSHGVFDSFLDPFRTGYGVAIGGQGINNTDKKSYYIVENTLSFNKRFNKHAVEALVGSVAQKFSYENSSIQTRNFASASVTTPNGGSELFDASAWKSERANASFLSRVNYSFDDKYLLTANFRADGSSVFGPNQRWGYFPSFSVGWRVSNENFMKEDSFINDLKIRAGWGIVGNDNINAYSYLGRVGSGANYPFGGAAQPGTYPASIENLELKWEESEQTNIGFDLTMFDNRVNLTADAYIKKTNDLLLNAPLPTATGFDNAIRNIGEIQNKGIEFALNTVNIQTESLSWKTGFNISFNRNEVISLVGQELLQGGITGGRGEASLVREGEPLGPLYGYIFGGVDPTTGDAYYVDKDGNSTFTPSADDRTIIGDANPDFFYGITSNLNYKGFGLFVFLQGSQGNDMLNVTRIDTEGMIDPKNQSIAVLNRWRQPGDITDIPRASFGNSDNSRVSTRFIEDASYLRFKTITLSYDLPQTIIDKLGITALKIYGTGENMFTITDYSGFDPEVNAFGGSNTVQGIDFGTYPQTRNVIFGINATF
ncbi:TonB-linked SusC/RagA family outer membrane protein [Winogradskyella pacifica]|uniref:TonB-linked SusC/RagA family outer membrane protein n=2 Tax=Winogradskyella pacifica TaxID=664642 RepID=A0A3D9N4J0_9FLAO|nr:TonB-linked SusC/RagA family outer membrane protein [Winogradskyella pacifica]